MRIQTIALTALASVLLFSAGCNTQAQWTYPLDTNALFRAEHTSPRYTVAVLPTREGRPVTNQGGTYWLYAVPLMPYGWSTYERPEAALMFNTISKYWFNLEEDLGKAAARSFEESGLFRRVYFTQGGETREADFLLYGKAHRTTYEGKIYSYCLSLFGPLLWFIGLPAGESKNSIEFILTLEDKQGQELWSYQFAGEEAITQGLYYNWGTDVMNFSVLTQRNMNEALRDLASKLPEIEKRVAGIQNGKELLPDKHFAEMPTRS